MQQQDICPYKTGEDMFLGAVANSTLAREAKAHSMSMSDLLVLLIWPLGGGIEAHLLGDPKKSCLVRMTQFLQHASVLVECPPWADLVSHAVGRKPYGEEAHIERCGLCKRDIAQIRAKLPTYDLFNVSLFSHLREEPKTE